MIRKLFLLMLIGLVGGCTTLTKHPTSIKNSFVQINKSVKIEVCGETTENTNECKELLNMKSTGSGAVVWNEYLPGKTPRTLVLTADHICENEKYSLEDFDRKVYSHIKDNLKFKGKVKVITKPSMLVVNAYGKKFKVKEFPWVRNVSADTCIVETSINAPILEVGAAPQYGDKVYNIAAPKGIYNPSATGGGVFFTEGLYNGEFIIKTDKTGRLFSMYNLSAAPGSSGSPIVNKNGEIVGMVHSIDSRYCNLITGQCNSPVSYSATLEQVRNTLLEALAAIKRGEAVIFDYKKVNQ